MKKEEKNQVIAELRECFRAYPSFYITDASGLNVEQVNRLRKTCYEKGVVYRVAKNTLIKKALGDSKQADPQLLRALEGPSGIFFTGVSGMPAKILKEFRKTNEKPLLKAAFIEKDVYVGDKQLAGLAALKSKNELIAETVAMLQSPLMRVMLALQSAGNNITGVVKTLSERKSA